MPSTQQKDTNQHTENSMSCTHKHTNTYTRSTVKPTSVFGVFKKIYARKRIHVNTLQAKRTRRARVGERAKKKQAAAAKHWNIPAYIYLYYKHIEWKEMLGCEQKMWTETPAPPAYNSKQYWKKWTGIGVKWRQKKLVASSTFVTTATTAAATTLQQQWPLCKKDFFIKWQASRVSKRKNIPNLMDTVLGYVGLG